MVKPVKNGKVQSLLRQEGVCLCVTLFWEPLQMAQQSMIKQSSPGVEAAGDEVWVLLFEWILIVIFTGHFLLKMINTSLPFSSPSPQSLFYLQVQNQPGSAWCKVHCSCLIKAWIESSVMPKKKLKKAWWVTWCYDCDRNALPGITTLIHSKNLPKRRQTTAEKGQMNTMFHPQKPSPSPSPHHPKTII